MGVICFSECQQEKKKMSKKTYYDVLRVSKNADLGVVEAAYRNLNQYYHPDNNPGDPHAERELRAINRAYAVLSDPEKRRRYDLAPWDADDVPVNRTDVIAPSNKASKPSFVSENAATHCRASDEWLMRIWTYVVLPALPALMFAYVLFGKDGNFNHEQLVFMAACAGLTYGLHVKNMWAWYINWLGILALAGVLIKFGVFGGILGGLWVWWNFTAWKRLKSRFSW